MHTSENPRYEIKRTAHNLETIENTFHEENEDDGITVATRIRYLLGQLPSAFSLNKILRLIFPIFFILKEDYCLRFLISDLLGGLTMCAMNIPQGLAYGMLAGLKPIYGLYTSFFPLVIYALLGSSRHLCVGTFALTCLMMSEPIERLTEEYLSSNVSIAATNVDEDLIRVQVASTLAFTAGIVEIVLGLLHIGFLTVYLHEPLVDGFNTGAAVLIFTSQVPGCLGFHITRQTGIGKLVKTYIVIFSNIGRTNLVTLALSFVCIVILIATKFYLNPKLQKRFSKAINVPIELILMIIGTGISYGISLNARHTVTIVGTIPSGLPLPSAPKLATFGVEVLPDAVAIAVVGFVMSASIMKMFAYRLRYTINYNQELVALGLGNVFGAFFQCMFATGALARSSVVAAAGMQFQQVASMVAAIFMLFTLLVLTSYIQYLPVCILSSIIVVGISRLFRQMKSLKVLYTACKADFLIWLVTFFGVLILDVVWGLVLAVVFSFITIVVRTQIPNYSILGQLPGTDLYEDVRNFKSAIQFPGVAIFRFNSAVYFANSQLFLDLFYEHCLKITMPHRLSVLVPYSLEPSANVSRRSSIASTTTRRASFIRPRGNSVAPYDAAIHSAPDIDRNRTAISVIEYDDNLPFSLSEKDCIDTLSPSNGEVAQVEPINELGAVAESTFSQPTIKSFVIFDCTPWNFIDATGINMVRELCDEQCIAGVKLLFCNPPRTVRHSILQSVCLLEDVFPTIHDAVLYAFAALNSY